MTNATELMCRRPAARQVPPSAAFQQLVRDRRCADSEASEPSTPGRNFVAPWYLLRPYGWKRLGWETLGVVLMLMQVCCDIGYYGEENAQRFHYERCMAGRPGFSTEAEREAAQSPMLVSPPLSGRSATGKRWYHLDVATGIAFGEYVERPPPTTVHGLLDQQIRHQLKRTRRLRCEPIHKAVSPLTGVKEKRCGRLCWLADGVKVTVDVYDLLNFFLLFATAYKLTTRDKEREKAKAKDGEECVDYEYRPRRIARFRLTRWYLPFQLFIATPSYYLASRGGLRVAVLTSLRGSLLSSLASRPWETCLVVLRNGVPQSALKVVRLVRFVLKLVKVVMRLLRLRTLLTKLANLFEIFRRRARLEQRVEGMWRRVRLSHTDGLGLAARVESPSKETRRDRKPGLSWKRA